MVFHGCLRCKVIVLSRSASRAAPSVTSISTLLRCKQHRVSFISSSPLIALPSLEPAILAAQFLRNLVKAVPYSIHTVLTDNGIQFTNHTCDRVYTECGIEYHLTKVKHPWINGQVERMNRTIKEATVKRFHYDDHTQLCIHLADFIAAYSFGCRLKTLRGLTPCEFISKQWIDEPEHFKVHQIHQMPGLNT